jgi:hypothetical protein
MPRYRSRTQACACQERREALAIAGHVCNDATPRMKASTLPWATALAVAVTSSIVPSAYSQGATNSINVTVPANGLALIGNPLNRGSNTLSEILPDPVVSTIRVFDFDPLGFDVLTKRTVSWPPPGSGFVFRPGKGFFLQNTDTRALSITFVGEFPEGTNTLKITPGYNLLAAHFPVAGKVETDLGLPAVNGDKVFRFDTAAQGFLLYTRRTSGWTPTEPVIGVAEGFFFVMTNSVS